MKRKSCTALRYEALIALCLVQVFCMVSAKIELSGDDTDYQDESFTTTESSQLDTDLEEYQPFVQHKLETQPQRHMRGPMLEFAKQRAILAWNDKSLTTYIKKADFIAAAFTRRYPPNPDCYWHVTLGASGLWGANWRYAQTGTFLDATFSGQGIVIAQQRK